MTFVCPVCGSPEVDRIDHIVPGEVLKDEYNDALICLNCDGIYLDPGDLVRIE